MAPIEKASSCVSLLAGHAAGPSVLSFDRVVKGDPVFLVVVCMACALCKM